MSSPIIPDYVSTIVGYRVWYWDTKQLRSLSGKRWMPGQPLTAKCPLTEKHESPIDGCTCGIYAAKNLQHLQTIGLYHFDSAVSGELVLHGEVSLWGKVVEHKLGFRAQFAYPKTFVIPPNVASGLSAPALQSLITYGADILTSTSALLWKQGVGYTSEGVDWLAQKSKPWHERRLAVGDCVTVLGRGVGVVEKADASSTHPDDSMHIRLRNGDVYVVPYDDIVPNAEEERWEVDLSKYKDATFVRSAGGYEIVCCSQRESRSSGTENSVFVESTGAVSHEPNRTSTNRRSSRLGVCGICYSLDVRFDKSACSYVCGQCGSKQTW
jgi:hypothetical protein